MADALDDTVAEVMRLCGLQKPAHWPTAAQSVKEAIASYVQSAVEPLRAAEIDAINQGQVWKRERDLEKRRETLFAVIEVDPAELAVRLCEANYELKRPSPDAKAALAAMDEDVRSAWLNTAKAAADYFAELLSKAKRVS